MGLRDFVGSFSQRWVDLEVHLEGGRSITGQFAVRPPSVREALIVLAAFKSALSGNDGDGDLFDRTVKNWLPQELVDALYAEGVPREERVKLIVEMTRVGGDADHDSDVKKIEKKVEDASWKSVVADYRAFFGADALVESWAYFVGQFTEIDRLRARAQLDFIQAYTSCKSEEGLRGTVPGIQARAFPGVDFSGNIEQPEWVDDEWFAVNLAKARRFGSRGDA